MTEAGPGRLIGRLRASWPADQSDGRPIGLPPDPTVPAEASRPIGLADRGKAVGQWGGCPNPQSSGRIGRPQLRTAAVLGWAAIPLYKHTTVSFLLTSSPLSPRRKSFSSTDRPTCCFLRGEERKSIFWD